jgi:hypothetical protein
MHEPVDEFEDEAFRDDGVVELDGRFVVLPFGRAN